MTQMYGKFALILALASLLVVLVKAQGGEPIPVLLNSQNETQKAAWQKDLTAAFGDQPLAWVEDEKDADIVVRTSVGGAEDELEITLIWVRQNMLHSISPILVDVRSAVPLSEEDIGEIALEMWELEQGECVVADEEGLMSELDRLEVYRANCELIAEYQADEAPDDKTITRLIAEFEPLTSTWTEAEINSAWLLYQAGHTEQAIENVSRRLDRALAAGTNRQQAFLYAKRAQFYALDFDYQAALLDLDQAIEANPENPLYLTRKGEVYLLLYEWNNAKDAFDAAIALDPEFALAYFQRGILRSTMIDIEAANADFSMYLSLEPRGVYAELARQYTIEASR